MPTDKERELYFQARDRALEREVEGTKFVEDAVAGFRAGLAATTPQGPLRPDYIDKIKSESNFSFAFFMGALCRLEAAKGKQYAASWQKQGEESAFFNLTRKYDRVEAMHAHSQNHGDSGADQLGDMAVYASKWSVLRCEIDPKEFEKWILYIRGL